MAYGVIGNTTDSGSVILGSSPGRPAIQDWMNMKEFNSVPLSKETVEHLSKKNKLTAEERAKIILEERRERRAEKVFTRRKK